MAAFATMDEVQASFPRTLTTPERNRGKYLLDAIAVRIRGRKKDISATSDAAKGVSVDLVVHALAVPLDLVGHTAYSRTVGPRSKSGSLDPARVGKLIWEDWHYELLELDDATFAGDPAYYFGDGADSDFRNAMGLPVAGLGRPSAW